MSEPVTDPKCSTCGARPTWHDISASYMIQCGCQQRRQATPEMLQDLDQYAVINKALAFDEALALLKKIDHTFQEYAWCTQCDGTTHGRGETFRHAPDCRLAAFLAKHSPPASNLNVMAGKSCPACGKAFEDGEFAMTQNGRCVHAKHGRQDMSEYYHIVGGAIPANASTAPYGGVASPIHAESGVPANVRQEIEDARRLLSYTSGMYVPQGYCTYGYVCACGREKYGVASQHGEITCQCGRAYSVWRGKLIGGEK